MSTFSRPYFKTGGKNPTYIVGNIDKNLNMKIGACPSCTTANCTQMLNNKKCRALAASSPSLKNVCNEYNETDCSLRGCSWDGKKSKCVLNTCTSQNLSPAGCCLNTVTNSIGSVNSWNVGQPLPQSGICKPVDIDLTGPVRAAGWFPQVPNSNSSNCVSLGTWSSLPAILFYICLALLCMFIYFWARKTF